MARDPDRPGSATVDLVTGAFRNVGSAIARELSVRGRRVRTLTGHPPHGPQDHGREVLPFTWDDDDALADSFTGIRTFYNTYWMRMGDAHGRYDTAVQRCEKLIAAAEAAGVERIVHVSVAHPSLTSPYPYFRGKAQVEARLCESPISSAVARPALVFGGDSVMVNNLAWVLRRVPVFAVPGSGRYRVRPVHADDIARLCVDLGERRDHVVVDAVGPDRPSYREMVTLVRDAVGGRARIVPAPTPVVLAGAAVLGAVVGDDLVNRDELVSTTKGLADSDGPSTGTTSFASWVHRNAEALGRRYANERARRR